MPRIHPLSRRSQLITGWWWLLVQWGLFLLKNIVGWVLILCALPIGLTAPGPFGFPLFIIGFAMVTFPGKRRLTSRVLSGRRLQLHAKRYRVAEIVSGLLLPAFFALLVHHRGAIAVALHRYGLRSYHLPILGMSHFNTATWTGLYVLAAVLAWVGVHWGLRGVNLFLSLMRKMRRRVRPWLRQRGFYVLPPRWTVSRRMVPGRNGPLVKPSEKILEIDQRKIDRALWTVGKLRPLLKPVLGTLITIGIFVWMFKPVVKAWPQVHGRIAHTSLLRFAVAATMFAIFLFVFRAMSWRRILIASGHKLPVFAAARIWSTSELARYLPGVIWQVVGRVFLCKPYGVPGTVCSTSQVLELTIFVLANAVVSLACLPWFAGRMDAQAQWLLWGAAGMAPLLLLLIHPRIFYGLMDQIMRLIKKPPLARRLPGQLLAGLLGWNILALLWQGVAIWLLMGQPNALHLPFDRIGLLMGAYCLAWCAGFLAFWAPGGIGMREWVLVLVLRFALPPAVSRQFPDQISFVAFLAFLAVLLRLWTVAGEILSASFAYAVDHRGALGDLGNWTPPVVDPAVINPAILNPSELAPATIGPIPPTSTALPPASTEPRLTASVAASARSAANA